ncbi:hypothetical protein FisN_10Lh383 [Fistulifera solaris]|uniref:Uncharacterized protein n=1 Tax=Fistulifera solaris TaxID=1519565 RepID=A0A1Z5JUG1_FISSO|nr:hypothetical protein FisN_10Lh383 [Fistulifera solaris]|eukprot:GAX17685.1 hypothetical protein FisN_10Lh383 [Fistulifera solaris]
MNEDTPLLQIIPQDALSPEQRAFCRNPDIDLPLYRLLREPTHLDDFDWENEYDRAIWRDNQTIIYLSFSTIRKYDERRPFREKSVSFVINCGNKYILSFGMIYGKSDAAIAETATFFWSLKQSDAYNIVSLQIGNTFNEQSDTFDHGALSPEQLAQILDANPTRHCDMKLGTWSAEQSVILASRPYPLKLTLGASVVERDDCFRFSDGGTAFVEALQNRELGFGNLAVDFRTKGRNVISLSHINMKRLFKLPHMFDRLAIEGVDEEFVLLPFSAQVSALSYHLDAQHLQHDDLDSLDIAANNLT